MFSFSSFSFHVFSRFLDPLPKFFLPMTSEIISIWRGMPVTCWIIFIGSTRREYLLWYSLFMLKAWQQKGEGDSCWAFLIWIAQSCALLACILWPDCCVVWTRWTTWQCFFQLLDHLTSNLPIFLNIQRGSGKRCIFGKSGKICKEKRSKYVIWGQRKFEVKIVGIQVGENKAKRASWGSVNIDVDLTRGKICYKGKVHTSDQKLRLKAWTW